MSVDLHGNAVEERQVIVDTTVQEKNVTYPTDGKLAIKMIHQAHYTPLYNFHYSVNTNKIIN